MAAEIPIAWLASTMDALIFEAWANVENGEIAPKQAPWLVLGTFLAGHGTKETCIWLNEQRDQF